jgi:hypothetical protein
LQPAEEAELIPQLKPFNPEKEGSMFLLNTRIHLQDYTVISTGQITFGIYYKHHTGNLNQLHFEIKKKSKWHRVNLYETQKRKRKEFERKASFTSD